MRKTLEYILKILAKLTLSRYKPKIVGITGSVGKTSTKEAVFEALSSKFRVRKNYKNYNNEIGVPLTIIGSKTAGRSPFGWLFIFVRALINLIYNPAYPKILVLELGADKIGDIAYLTSFIKCDVGIITAISDIPAHVKFFRTPAQVAREKAKLLVNLDKNGWAILNFDDGRARAMAAHTKAKVVGFGFSQDSDIRISNLETNLNDLENTSISFKINYGGSTVPFRLDEILNEKFACNFAAAAGAGLYFGMNLVEISQAIKKFKKPLGRMNLIKGIKNTWIIDDTYNASPAATKSALDVFGKIKNANRKVAVLGDMLELGAYAERAHREAGTLAAEYADILLAVGSHSIFMVEEAKAAGMPRGNAFHFLSARQAASALQGIMQEGDLILIKGSQSMRMERVVKEIMAEPGRAKELLVRQENDWSKE